MTPKEIEAQLTTLFPTDGREETLTMEDPAIQELQHAINDQWDALPEALQVRVDSIVDHMCAREIPFALRILRWLKDDDDPSD